MLVLRYYEALPDREIAELVGVGEATVRSLASRAFATLREHPQLADFAPAPPPTPDFANLGVVGTPKLAKSGSEPEARR